MVELKENLICFFVDIKTFEVSTYFKTHIFTKNVNTLRSSLNCICRKFLIVQFLAKKLWVRIPFQTGDSPQTVFLYLRVNFHKFVSVAF